MLQSVVPIAMPSPPRSFTHDTCDTPRSSAAVPAIEITPPGETYTGSAVGDAIVTVGGRLPSGSSSTIVTLTDAGPRIVAPRNGCDSVTVNSSLSSSNGSCAIGMTICFEDSPSMKISVPLDAVKSATPSAVTPFIA